MRGIFRFEWIGKDPLCQRGAFSLPQKLDRAFGEQDGPHSGIGLGVSLAQSAAFLHMDRAADVQCSGLAVKISPFQTAQLSPPQAGGQLHIEEVVPERVPTDCRHQRVQLVVVEDTLRTARQFGRRHALGGIGRQKALLHRGFQRVVKGRVDAVDSGGREAAALPSGETAVFQEMGVQIIQISGCNFCQLFLPQAGLDMVVQVPPVPVQRIAADGPGHAPVQPLIQPLREGHSALLRQINALVGVDVLTELRRQLFLGIGIDVAEDGIAVIFVAHHDPALPASVVPLAYHAVAGRSSFAHMESSPFQLHNIPARRANSQW